MIKKTLSILFVLLFSAGMLSAKSKAIQLKKFKHADIGNPAVVGSSSILGDRLSMEAGGADVWGPRDEFRFSYMEQNGDFDLSARIENLSSPHLYTKAGLMAREELSDNSRHIYFQVFPDNSPRNKNNGGYEFQYRPLKGAEMKAIYPSKAEGTPEFPVNYPNTWIRLKRTGNDFTGYYSADGLNWKVFANYTLELPKKLYLGLATTSHNVSENTTAVFTNISMNK